MVVFHTHTLGLVTFSCVYLLIIYADYTLVYQVIEYGKEPSTSRTLKALFAHFIVALSFIAHLRTMLSDPGYVPLPATKIDFSSDLERPDPNQKKKKKEPPPIDAWTVCTKCETYRPPRSHHCKKCRRCVRRMDHHCPWVNNCVGELNFKYFYLFLVYIGIFCLYAIILIIGDWRAHYNDNSQSTTDKVMTLLLFFEAVVFGMFVTAIGLGQTIAVLCDRNALEVHRYGHPMKFPDTPKLQLIQALCGRGSKILWCLPCVAPRIPDPIPPSKYSSAFNSIHSV